MNQFNANLKNHYLIESLLKITFYINLLLNIVIKWAEISFIKIINAIVYV